MKKSKKDLKKQIKLIVFDFDGVMTDNTVMVDENGKEVVRVNRSDGLGVRLLMNNGYPCMILSTEKNPVVSKRGEKLGIPVLQGIDNKKVALVNYCTQQKTDLDSVLYIGNDLNDLEVMKAVGLRGAPADAYKEIKTIADIIFRSKGGKGVVRELASWLLK